MSKLGTVSLYRIKPSLFELLSRTSEAWWLLCHSTRQLRRELRLLSVPNHGLGRMPWQQANCDKQADSIPVRPRLRTTWHDAPMTKHGGRERLETN